MRKDITDFMRVAKSDGVAYLFFLNNYEAKTFYQLIKSRIKHDYTHDWNFYTYGVKSYMGSHMVYLTMDEKALPFHNTETSINKDWVIRNLTHPEYLGISGLPDEMKDSHDWIKQKCEEVLGCEVEIEIYESQYGGWIAKIRRKNGTETVQSD